MNWEEFSYSVFPLSTSKVRISFFLQVYADKITGEIVVEIFVDKVHFPDLVLLFSSVFCYLPSLRFLHSSLVLILLLFFTLFLCYYFTMHFFFQKVFLSYSSPLTLYELIGMVFFLFINPSESHFEIGDIFLSKPKWSLLCSVSSWS